MSQSRFLDPASALFAAKRRPRSRNVSTAGSCRKCRCQEGALASRRRSETATPKLKGRRSVGPALVGCLHLGLSLGSFRSIACNYAGLRGEGSTPVPLPPPACPRPCILRANFLATSPVTAAISHLSSGLLIGRVGLLFSERPVSLRSSGLHRFGTILEIRTFRITYDFRRKEVLRLLSDRRECPISNSPSRGSNPPTPARQSGGRRNCL
jgi:hypothetical protein